MTSNPGDGGEPDRAAPEDGDLRATLLGRLAEPSDGFRTASLIGAIRDGDQTAAAQLCTDHWRGLDLLARRSIGRPPAGSIAARLEMERDDLVQHVLSTACLEIREGRLVYQGPGRLSAWLRRTLRYHISDRRDYWRSRSEQPLAASSTGTVAPDAAATGPGVSTAAFLNEKYERVRAAVGELDEHEQIIVELRVFHGLAWSDVAAQVSEESGTPVTEDAVRMRFKPIRTKLALLLDALDES